MKYAALQTGLCGVTKLCRYQDWMDRNTSLLAGKTFPIHVFHLCMQLFTCSPALMFFCAPSLFPIRCIVITCGHETFRYSAVWTVTSSAPYILHGTYILSAFPQPWMSGTPVPVLSPSHCPTEWHESFAVTITSPANGCLSVKSPSSLVSMSKNLPIS